MLVLKISRETIIWNPNLEKKWTRTNIPKAVPAQHPQNWKKWTRPNIHVLEEGAIFAHFRCLYGSAL